MFISKRKIKASNQVWKKRTIEADEALDEQVVDVPVDEDIDDAAGVMVEPEATDLLFEVEDVAELVAEVTGEAVEVSVDDETGAATFAIGAEEFTVEPEGDEEILESVRRPLRNKKPVAASRKVSRHVRTSKTK